MEKIEQIERPSTLMALVYKKIKALLVNGRLKPGEIYSAQYFSEILSVSRTPIREALLRLVTEGYLNSVQQRGFRIREFSEKEVKDFFETRKIIETYVVEHLIEKLTEQDCKELEDCLTVVSAEANKGDEYAFLEADKEFHINLVRRQGNFLLKLIMENIRNFLALLGQKALSFEDERKTEDIISEHKIILQALRQKDRKKAVGAVIQHLKFTEESCLRALRNDPGGSLHAKHIGNQPPA